MRTDARSARPRYSPVPHSSSQRAPQAEHSHESMFTDATKRRATSYESQKGQRKWLLSGLVSSAGDTKLQRTHYG